jgi:hypothetical protein
VKRSGSLVLAGSIALAGAGWLLFTSREDARTAVGPDEPSEPRDALAAVAPQNDVAPTPPTVDSADDSTANDASRDAAEDVPPPPALDERLAGIVRTTDGSRLAEAKVRLEIVDLDAVLAGPRGVARFDLAVSDAKAPRDGAAAIPAPILVALETETNEIGEFEFRDLPCPAPQLFVERRERLLVEKEGFETTAHWPFRRELAEIVAKRRAPLSGLCRDDATDAPIPNAELIVTRSRADEGERHELTTHTDPDGRFVTEKPLSEGVYSFTILRDGHAPRTFATAIRFDLFDLEFENHPTYVIRVKDATSSNPLAGARIFAEPDVARATFELRCFRSLRGPDGRHPAVSGPTGTDDSPSLSKIDAIGATDSGGELRVRDLTPFTRLLIEADGFASKLVSAPAPLAHGADRQVIEVELRGFAYLLGRVTDFAGRPLAGIRVNVPNDPSSRTIAETDSDGRFRFPTVPTQGLRGVYLRTKDETGEYRSESFPMARVTTPGESVDLGTVALIRNDAREVETRGAPRVPPESATIEATTSSRAPVVEVWRRSRKPGFDRRFVGAEFRAGPEFVGFAVADRTGAVEIHLSKPGERFVSVTAHDGVESRVIGEFDPE